jgi:hypothetical protein
MRLILLDKISPVRLCSGMVPLLQSRRTDGARYALLPSKVACAIVEGMNPHASLLPQPQTPADQNFMLRLREALEASWDRQTASQNVEQAGNRAYGQCYPTSRVIQHFYPAAEIVKGKVWTGEREEVHFWNALLVGDAWYHIDLSWQQFPAGSVVREFVVLDRRNAGDSEATVQRCALLLTRVETYLAHREVQ